MADTTRQTDELEVSDADLQWLEHQRDHAEDDDSADALLRLRRRRRETGLMREGVPGGHAESRGSGKARPTRPDAFSPCPPVENDFWGDGKERNAT